MELHCTLFLSFMILINHNVINSLNSLDWETGNTTSLTPNNLRSHPYMSIMGADGTSMNTTGRNKKDLGITLGKKMYSLDLKNYL